MIHMAYVVDVIDLFNTPCVETIKPNVTQSLCSCSRQPVLPNLLSLVLHKGVFVSDSPDLA